MNFKVIVVEYDNNFMFVLDTPRKIYGSSYLLSKILNVDQTEFNRILVEKVIQHDHYIITDNSTHNQYSSNDFYFKLNYTSRETYIERFKNTFNKELTLLALGGNWNGSVTVWALFWRCVF